jgi:nickel/cobalt exporter
MTLYYPGAPATGGPELVYFGKVKKWDEALMLRWMLLLLLVLALPASVGAHPVPRDNHDRTIVVRLGWDAKARQFVVQVAYRLEVDEYTAYQDLAALIAEADLEQVKSGERGRYGEFLRLYAPILAGNLIAQANGKRLRFLCNQSEYHLKDEQGQALGHLRCDFIFRAVFPPAAGQQRFYLQELNYLTQAGKIDLSLVSDAPVHFLTKSEPDAALKKRAETLLAPGDEEKLRQVSATFELSDQRVAGAGSSKPRSSRHLGFHQLSPSNTNERGGEDPYPLFHLFLDSDGWYFWLTLLLAAGFGAVHALTPGHGKTMVAAYLVGERGTSLHALVLGLATTLTHTGAVLVLALVLNLAEEGTRQAVNSGLGLVAGLAVLGIGAWLLLRRLAGQADHFHFGSGHHHHHHHEHDHAHHHHPHDHAHADHEHDEHGNIIPKAARERPSWWAVIGLGMSGGLVPCWDAILVLLAAISAGRAWEALPLLLAFSAGLAAVLVVIGILVVHVRGFAVSRWGEGRLVRILPLLSAAAITVLGAWLCYHSLATLS